MYDFYYFNGDSYTAGTDAGSWVDFFVQPDYNYFNHAIIGSSNHRIFRDSIETLHKLKQKHGKIFCIIGFSFVSRDEIYSFEKSKLVTLNGVLDEKNIPDELKLKLHFQDINHQMMHFYTHLYMFVNLLEKWGIDYFVFSAADNSDFGTLNWDWLKSNWFYNEITKNPKIYNFHNFNIKQWAEINKVNVTSTSHLFDDTGYSLFAQEIKNKIKNLN